MPRFTVEDNKIKVYLVDSPSKQLRYCLLKYKIYEDTKEKCRIGNYSQEAVNALEAHCLYWPNVIEDENDISYMNDTYSKNCRYHNTIGNFISDSKRNFLLRIAKSYNEDGIEINIDNLIAKYEHVYEKLQFMFSNIPHIYYDLMLIYQYRCDDNALADTVIACKEKTFIIRLDNKPVEDVLDYYRVYHREIRNSDLYGIVHSENFYDRTYRIIGKNKECSSDCIAEAIIDELPNEITKIDIDTWLLSYTKPTTNFVDTLNAIINNRIVPSGFIMKSDSLLDQQKLLINIAKEADEYKKHTVVFCYGSHATGKTTLGLRFLLEMMNLGISSTYISGTDSIEELIEDVTYRNTPEYRELRNNDKYAYLEKCIKGNNVVILDANERTFQGENIVIKNTQLRTKLDAVVDIASKQLDWCVVLVLLNLTTKYNIRGYTQYDVLEAVLNKSKKPYDIYCCKQIKENFTKIKNINVNDKLYLKNNISIVSDVDYNEFVVALLKGDLSLARTLTHELLKDNFKITIIRDITSVKNIVLYPSPIDGSAKDIHSSSTIQQDYINKFPIEGNYTYNEIECNGYDLQDIIIDWSYLDWQGEKWCSKDDEQPIEKLLKKYKILLTRTNKNLTFYIPNDDEYKKSYKALNTLLLKNKIKRINKHK